MPIRRKKLKYRSDYMSRQMDDRLEQIEERLSALYKASTKEMQAKLEEFTNSYEKNSELMRAKVEAGEMTEEEYALWTQRHIIQTDRYKATIDSLATMAVNADKAAMALVNGELPYVIAQSYNFTTSLGWKAADEAGLSVGTFQVYNADSVQKLIRDNPDILPVVDVPEDERWNRNRINQEITKSIINGDSSQQVADRLRRVTNMDENSAVRNARTAMTSAENMGRAEAADYLKSKGVPMDEVWSATYDDRTRETHLMLDGTKRDENGVFGADILLHPLRFPADPLGDPEEIYNCRCRLNLVLQGIDHSQDDDLYEKFMQEQHPEDWKNLQENRGYQDKLEQKGDALQAKADLNASKRIEMQERVRQRNEEKAKRR